MTLVASPNQSRLLPLAAAYVRSFFVGVTGLTLTVTISKAGAAFGAAAGAVAEISSGWYKISLTSADTDTEGDLAVHATDGGVNTIDWSDEVAAPVKLADGVAHGGTPGSSTATLALEQINVSATGFDNAITVQGFTGVYVSATGNSSAVYIDGSSGVRALSIAGGTGGAISVIDPGGSGAVVQIGDGGGGGPAIAIDGNSGHPAMLIMGKGVGGQEAVRLVGGESSSGLVVLGLGTAPAVQLGDGSSDGAEGLKILAGTGNTDAAGILVLGTGTGPAMQLGDGSGGGTGLLIKGNDAGSPAVDLESLAGNALISNSGQAGFFITSTGDSAASLVGSGQYGLNIEGANGGVNIFATNAFPGIIVSSGDAGVADIHLSGSGNLLGKLTGIMAELPQGAPVDEPTLEQAIMLMYMALKNQGTSTATLRKVFNKVGVAISKNVQADDGTTFTQSKMVTGP